MAKVGNVLPPIPEGNTAKSCNLMQQTALAHSDDLSVEGVFHLHRLWQKTVLRKYGHGSQLCAKEWALDRALLDLIGIGLQPGLVMLYQCSELESLTEQIKALKLSDTEKQRINQTLIKISTGEQVQNIPKVLTEQQLEFWQQHGYLVVPGVLSAEQCENSRQAIWQFLKADPAQPQSWYSHQQTTEKIMLSLFRHPALDANRQVLLIRQVFEQLWQRTDLVMTTDRVSFNPPETQEWRYPGPDLHWDMQLKLPIEFATQGLIYLTDTTEQQGAFCCVPGFHQKIESWIKQQGKDEISLQQQDWSLWPVKAIAAKAGDLVIWHHALPHGPSPNRANTPRMVQYINCYPITRQRPDE